MPTTPLVSVKAKTQVGTVPSAWYSQNKQDTEQGHCWTHYIREKSGLSLFTTEN
jgi:hypothetical protein